ncbi:BMC domain-containing protein [Gracilibacillus massiliensis]|uniref:BMC domain-containing protein n=1 Tax=Gracilibacillus massiliensis TaxID=1564956 RepID=UPI00071E2B4A|nr:BMC domain-containing protein [Gracilibacillus massiliensis]
MTQHEAIGIIETKYFPVAMEMLDQVTKAADVEFLTSHNQLGGKLVSLIIGGSISDVTLAIETAKRVDQTKPDQPLKNAVVITNPHPEILKYAIPSTKKAEKQPTAKKQATRKTRTTKKQATKTIEEDENNE